MKSKELVECIDNDMSIIDADFGASFPDAISFLKKNDAIIQLALFARNSENALELIRGRIVNLSCEYKQTHKEYKRTNNLLAAYLLILVEARDPLACMSALQTLKTPDMQTSHLIATSYLLNREIHK